MDNFIVDGLKRDKFILSYHEQSYKVQMTDLKQAKQFSNYNPQQQAKEMITNKTQQLQPQKAVPQVQTGLTKYATLSPYLIEIEKRKKAKQLSKDLRAKSKNQNSSKSFRIKERSTTSLRNQSRRELNNKTIINIISKIQARKKEEGGRRDASGQDKYKYYSKERAREKERENIKERESNRDRKAPNTCTIKLKSTLNRTVSRHQAEPQNKSISAYTTQKVNPKAIPPQNTKKDTSFRKNKYEFEISSKGKSRNQMTISNEDHYDIQIRDGERDRNKQTIQVSKYGYTDTNRAGKEKYQEKEKEREDIGTGKTTQNLYGIGKKKFRRGKYQALYSSVNSNDPHPTPHPPIKSQSRLQSQISKKQSNLSINKEFQLELIAQKQREKHYHQLRSKQIHKSLQKSTEKYFKQDSTYRNGRTNNQIQIYVSTVKNPSLGNRQSNASTLYSLGRNQAEVSDTRGRDRGTERDRITERVLERDSKMLIYDFEFRETDPPIAGITQIDNPSEQDSMSNNFQEETSFEKQRKAVEKQYFHKKSPQVDWSDDDCQIGEI